jgi:asparagine synthase (glutamine-hydrolysing)
MSHWPDPAAVVLGAREPERDDPAGSMTGVALRMMLTDAVTYLPDDILTKVDRASMGVSLEVRVPLLDHRVYEFAWRVPSSMKLRDGRGKWLLRRVLERYVPREMIDRPKMGFGIPLHDWLRGSLRDWAESLLDPARLRREAFFDPAPVRAAWDDHLSGRRNLQPALWSVLMFQSWVESTARRETVHA